MKFLFDLGGIFFDWHPKYYFINVFKSKKKMDYFLNNICNHEWNLKQDAGRKIKEAEEELISKFPKYSKEIKSYYPNHRNMIRKVYQDSVEMLFVLKQKNYLCYVLSNWSAETFIGMTDDYPFLKQFDGFLISGEVKLAKPSKEIYELAISKFKLIPEKTIFVDDRLENINTANSLGFNTVHLKNPNTIKEKLKKFI